MLALERRQRILQWVQKEGRAEVAELAAVFNVSPMTIRRDLQALAAQGLLTRARGGAVANNLALVGEIPYQDKVVSSVAFKRAIASAAAQLVEDGDTLILDAGSTTLELARQLKQKCRHLKVITTDLYIAFELADREDFTVILTPGRVQAQTHCLIGIETVEFIRNLQVKVAFLGAGAFDNEGIYTPTMEKAHLKRALLTSAALKVLVADYSKFGQRALVKVCDWNDLDIWFSDERMEEEIRESIASRGPQVIVVQMDEERRKEG